VAALSQGEGTAKAKEQNIAQSCLARIAATKNCGTPWDNKAKNVFLSGQYPRFDHLENTLKALKLCLLGMELIYGT
jgi:hypothetical protein